ncbi:MAG: hypothetical protein A2Y64_05775 [Candidatus Coatesbacteria bacterium RBG_13_66_14]|uniref:Uncharacterized protein n=1 Tax=Candidatus Coatesbacteria bacterium RBG_13_66_14 TaxID=1817816 RepID=A0A1F5FFY0_9BACT|nr:MAG: hypothetical protein A2Y64_05775 [Candidatus Coatesbacteria bacterium RBG_13_66_14]
MVRKAVAILLFLAVGTLLAEAPYPMPEGSMSYWEFFGDTSFTPGRGFVGKLELGDLVSDMYDRIGGGMEEMDYPFWYFFEDGPYAFTVIGQYDTASMSFPIVGLALGGLADFPPPGFTTPEGVGIGATWPDVVAAYGRPPLGVRAAGASYPELGLVVYLDNYFNVSTLFVQEPGPSDEPSGMSYVNDGVELPQVVTPAKGILAVPLPEGWSLTDSADVTAFYADPADAWNVQVSTCVDCSDDVTQWADMQEGLLYGSNLLPDYEWYLHPDALAAYGADESYCAEYSSDFMGHSWSLFLRRNTQTVNVTVNCLDTVMYGENPEGADRLVSAILAGLEFVE